MTDKAIIFRPDTPEWVRYFIDESKWRGQGLAVALSGIVAFIASFVGVFVGPVALHVVSGVVLAAILAVVIIGAIRASRCSVDDASWKFEGKPIVGEGRDLIVDAVRHASAIEQYVSEIPTKLDWTQFKPHVEALLWDAAGHAAEVCQLNQQLNDLRYGEPGSPQAIRREELLRLRADHLALVAGATDELRSVAAAAGNAAAAAALALEHTGRAADLEVASPSAPALIAQGGMSEALKQLKLLADTWSEVDAAQSSRTAAPAPRARRLRPPSGRQQEG
jgi:hypothetical protein